MLKLASLSLSLCCSRKSESAHDIAEIFVFVFSKFYIVFVFVFISVFVFGKIRNSRKMEHDTAEIGESKIMKDIGKQ